MICKIWNFEVNTCYILPQTSKKLLKNERFPLNKIRNTCSNTCNTFTSQALPPPGSKRSTALGCRAPKLEASPGQNGSSSFPAKKKQALKQRVLPKVRNANFQMLGKCWKVKRLNRKKPWYNHFRSATAKLVAQIQRFQQGSFWNVVFSPQRFVS